MYVLIYFFKENNLSIIKFVIFYNNTLLKKILVLKIYIFSRMATI